ncbi:uncharacterized protein LOC106997183 [Macaca mulatta]
MPPSEFLKRKSEGPTVCQEPSNSDHPDSEDLAEHDVDRYYYFHLTHDETKAQKRTAPCQQPCTASPRVRSVPGDYGPGDNTSGSTPSKRLLFHREIQPGSLIHFESVFIYGVRIIGSLYAIEEAERSCSMYSQLRTRPVKEENDAP